MPTTKTDENFSIPTTISYVSASPSDLTANQLDLVDRLVRIHGSATLHAEANGVHMYVASPMALYNDGEVELRKRHLAINLTKWAHRPNGKIALCMKTRTPYSIPELLSHLPIDKRGLNLAYIPGPGKVRQSNVDHYEEIRPGVFVPHNPGTVIPLPELPQDHPAIVYLRDRRYDPLKLYQQFACSWCVATNPKLYEIPFPNGMKETTRNRLIFFVLDQRGDPVGWQARYLDRELPDGTVEYFHPYLDAYVPVAKKQDGKRVPLPNYETLKWAKYKTSPGAHRNQMLMGYQAALQWSREAKDPYFVLTEGPLDAARIGVPGCAVMGKFVSQPQMGLALSIARRGFYLTQNDTAAEQAAAQILRMATALSVDLKVIKPPASVNDFGDLRPAEARAWFACHAGVQPSI